MRDNVQFKIAAGCLREMTTEQFKSLREITARGNWETVTEDVIVNGTDYVGVHLPDIFIGIEKDGHAHS
jgi:hypothetical protein